MWTHCAKHLEYPFHLEIHVFQFWENFLYFCPLLCFLFSSMFIILEMNLLDESSNFPYFQCLSFCSTGVFIELYLSFFSSGLFFFYYHKVIFYSLYVSFKIIPYSYFMDVKFSLFPLRILANSCRYFPCLFLHFNFHFLSQSH